MQLEKSDKIEAARLALPIDIFMVLKHHKALSRSMPKEKCTCASLDGIFTSLLEQYNVDELMHSRKPEFKKGKEIFLTCLFAYIIRDVNSIPNIYDICIPVEDRGTDTYIREIDREKCQIIHHPIQICEMPERFLDRMDQSESPTKKVYRFIKKKKLKHYPKSPNALFVWLEFAGDRRLDIASLRTMMQTEESVIPFTQIILMGRGKGGMFNVFSIYSRNSSREFAFQYNYRTRTVVKLNPINS